MIKQFDVNKLLYALLWLVIFCALMYGMYWLVKSMSYWLFYEEMVKETIIELVKQDALK